MEQEIDFTNEANAKAAANAGGIPKNFRQQADMEAFYRFVHENDLREPALEILDKVRAQRAVAKAARKPKN
ncbi:MAG TPA: hypothetical protein VIH99_09085 [Bdellovibrionota bacterium]|jgi:hypothetical protein